MGTKACRIVTFLVALAVLIAPVQCHAASVSELYQLYDKEFEVEIPEDVIQTITTYNNAKKYVSMYNYVVNSEYDIRSIEKEINMLTSEIEYLKSQLLCGFDKTTTELYELEEAYRDCYLRRADLESTLNTFNVNVEQVSAENVPTYSEYIEAMRTKNDLSSTLEIGQLEGLTVPAQSQSQLLDHSKDFSSYRVIDSTGVLSLFNGVVDDVIVDDEYGLTVIVDNYNGVKSYFCNLEVSSVVPGETVYQGQRVGYVYGTKLILRLQLKDDFVDVSKLLVEE